VSTPNLDALVSQGVELDRFYAHKFCGPSRAALQTGRLPIHVTVLDDNLADHNPKDPDGGYQGIPRNMTGIATKLRGAGYATAMAGKWHNGVATPDHVPSGRGYDQALTYFDAANDHWTSAFLHPCPAGVVTDLWNTTKNGGVGAPATRAVNPPALQCSQANQAAGCVYEDDKLLAWVLDVVARHDPATPLFLVLATHGIHEPYEVPQRYLDRFAFIDVEVRRYYAAMVAHVDDVVGNLTAALKAKGMWDNTLFVSSSDNGGPLAKGDIVGLNNTSGANNYPLRGGKIGVMEGGVRVNAFVSGGWLPAAVRGTKSEAFVHIADWYATFCALAGVDPTDARAAAAGLPAIDSLDAGPAVWGGAAASARVEVPIGSSDGNDNSGNTLVQALIDVPSGLKLILGDVDPAFFQGPTYPNSSSTVKPPHLVCGDPDASGAAKGPGCLFDVLRDPSETTDLASRPAHAADVARLRKRIRELQKTVYNPDRGAHTPALCNAAEKTWGGFVGPFLP
jgi:arylsulfatase B